MNMCNMEQETKTTPVAETWRPVKGYEGYYEVSDLARVRSLDRWVNQMNKGVMCERIYKGRILSQNKGTKYNTVLLSKDGISTTALVHRLVAKAFVPNPDNLPQVNHKDENKRNNLPSNLEWCDGTYNTNYGSCLKRRAKAQSRPIEQLTLDGQHVAYYDSAADAQRMSCGKFAKTNIYSVINGKAKTAYGYQWRYV